MYAPRRLNEAALAVPGSPEIRRQPGGNGIEAPVGMLAIRQPDRGGAGRSHANGALVECATEPVPHPVAATAAAASPASARLEVAVPITQQ